jgi:D-serine deaminase-like pyridoxal phosphate-dependent protein
MGSATGGMVRPEFGSTIEFLTSHCDPTVNLYGAFRVAREGEVIAVR